MFMRDWPQVHAAVLPTHLVATVGRVCVLIGKLAFLIMVCEGKEMTPSRLPRWMRLLHVTMMRTSTMSTRVIESQKRTWLCGGGMVRARRCCGWSRCSGMRDDGRLIDALLLADQTHKVCMRGEADERR